MAATPENALEILCPHPIRPLCAKVLLLEAQAASGDFMPYEPQVEIYPHPTVETVSESYAAGYERYSALALSGAVTPFHPPGTFSGIPQQAEWIPLDVIKPKPVRADSGFDSDTQQPHAPLRTAPARTFSTILHLGRNLGDDMVAEPNNDNSDLEAQVNFSPADGGFHVDAEEPRSAPSEALGVDDEPRMCITWAQIRRLFGWKS